MNERLIQLLKRHEGFRSKPYTDTTGHLSIAYGRNLSEVGISQQEGEFLLYNDLMRAHEDCLRNIPVYQHLDEVRCAVLVDMCFNMGIHGLLQFVGTLQAISNGDYDIAAEHMLNSLWASQVGNRAVEDVTMMRTGEWL